MLKRAIAVGLVWLLLGSPMWAQEARELIEKGSYEDVLAAASRLNLEDTTLHRLHEELKQLREEEARELKRQRKVFQQELQAAQRQLNALPADVEGEPRERLQCRVHFLEVAVVEIGARLKESVKIAYDNRLAKLQILGQWPSDEAEILRRIQTGAFHKRKHANWVDIGFRDFDAKGQLKDRALGERYWKQLKASGLLPPELDEDAARELAAARTLREQAEERLKSEWREAVPVEICVTLVQVPGLPPLKWAHTYRHCYRRWGNERALKDAVASLQFAQRREADALWYHQRATFIVGEIKRLVEFVRRHSDARNAEVHVLLDPVPNAFALPGGIFAVNTGLFYSVKENTTLVEILDEEAQFAGIIAHELAHVASRHAKDSTKYVLIAQIAMQIALAVMYHYMMKKYQKGELTYSYYYAMQGAQMLIYVLIAGGIFAVSRKYEREADLLATQTLAHAGYDPHGLLRAFDALATKVGPWHGWVFFRSHPQNYDRILAAMQESLYIEAAGIKLDKVSDTVRFQQMRLALRDVLHWKVTRDLIDRKEQRGLITLDQAAISCPTQYPDEKPN